MESVWKWSFLQYKKEKRKKWMGVLVRRGEYVKLLKLFMHSSYF